MATRVKICGLTNLADARAAVQAGADLLGFVFYPPSPRYVAPETVKDILAQLRLPHSVTPVGVFVDQSARQIGETLDFCGLHAAQLHGLSTVEGVGNALRGRAYPALRPASTAEGLTQAQRHALPETARCEGRLPALLLDSYHPQRVGGTGQTGNWPLAALLAQSYPLLLAGGLTPHNAADAVRRVRPWGVDVAGGVEKEPGLKDHAAVVAFIENVKKVRDEDA
jgi:phosphoribosylanthranilate isomerase